MRRTVLFLTLAFPLAAADVQSIECKEIGPPPLPKQMAKSLPQYNCTIGFTGKSKKTTLYVTLPTGAQMAFAIDKGQTGAAVSTGAEAAVSAKLGADGKLFTAPPKGPTTP